MFAAVIKTLGPMGTGASGGMGCVLSAETRAFTTISLEGTKHRDQRACQAIGGDYTESMGVILPPLIQWSILSVFSRVLWDARSSMIFPAALISIVT